MGEDNSQAILDFVKNCPAVFQSQQIGDPELTESDKKSIAEDILLNKPVKFLTKFGKFLNEEHLNYFLNKYQDSYEIEYYAKHYKALLNDRKKHIKKRNRRFEAMKRLEAKGNYFSEAEMEEREPFLYHQMVGQYLTESERRKKNLEANKNKIPTFSQFLLDKLEREELNELILLHKEEKEDFADNLENEKPLNTRWGVDWEDKKDYRKLQEIPKESKTKLSSEEKAFLYNEFKSLMQSKFLSGKYTDFNYSDVDSDSDYDCLDIRNQDEEEKYFDEENSNCSNDCTDTGIEDY